MYLIVTILLIAITLFFAVFPAFRKFREKNTFLSTFMITLVATGAGVFLALYFSNIEEKNKEKTNAVKLLSISHAELEGNISRVITALEAIKMIDDSPHTFKDYMEMYEIDRGFNLRNVLDNDIIMRNLSAEGVFLYALWNDNTSYAFKQLSNASSKGEIAYIDALLVYWIHLRVVAKMLDIEKQYIQGKIREKDILKQYFDVEQEYKVLSELKWDDKLKRLTN